MAAIRVILLLMLSPMMGCGASTQQRPAATSATLQQRLDEVLNRRASTGAVLAARVIDLENGRELYARGADQPMIPASNMKLFVTAAGLDLLGPEHSFKTYLAMDGNDLWVIGTGDPATGDPRLARAAGKKPTAMFDQWAAPLNAREISRLGALHYYDGALDNQWVHPSWSKSFLVDWYAAPVSGLNFNDNCIDIKVSPAEPGQAAKLEVMPPTKGVRIDNRIVTAAKDAKDAPAAKIDRAPSANVYTLTGATTRPTDLESKPVVDPGSFFVDAMRAHLATHGIEISGEPRRAERFDPSLLRQPKILAVHETSMKDLLNRLNKNSQNLFAEALCKIMGKHFEAAQGRDVPGSWEAGGRAVMAFFAKHAIAPGPFKLVDGSGLSRENRISARVTTDLLIVMHKHAQAKMYRESLSVAGQDGTLARRMTDLKGHIFAKTGYIGGVRTLSGYLKTREGKWLAFSFLYNGVQGSVKAFEELQDEACHILMEYKRN